MPIIILLSLVVAGGFAIAFVVAAQHGQYDDTQTPSMRMLFDDETAQTAVSSKNVAKNEEKSIINHNLHGRV